MKTVSVNASHPYNVYIGRDLLRELGKLAAQVSKAENVVIVTDSHVQPLYLGQIKKSLFDGGFRNFSTFVVAAGEASKNGTVYLELLNFLAQRRITRSDLLVALGGGVVGDLTGFAAATYLRGIDFIQVPTTLLAAVDSSVGGKTAIDLPAGKNLAGAFYQPRLVLCDLDTLSTLPPEIFRDGCAEVIKYAVLYDPGLFAHLKDRGLDFDREEVVSRCVSWKRDVVAADEFDRGARQKLNLGHTLGHGVEACSQFAVSHGSAVSIGMAMVARAGAKLGFCPPETRDAIVTLLHQFGLPTVTVFSPEALTAFALSDKKRSGGTLNLVVPRAIGDCMLSPTPVEALGDFVSAGMALDITLRPGLLQGTVAAIPSKSQAHRLLICAAFGDGETVIHCPETNRDIEATVRCLRALGADIRRTETGYRITPGPCPPKAELPCGESGSTLRFLLPVVGALGVDAVFHLEGRLSERPLSPLWEEMERMGCTLSRPMKTTIRCRGQLQSGVFRIAGNVSSQFISGLLFAAALLPGDSRVEIQGDLESRPYVTMTQAALARFGIRTEGFRVPGGQAFHTPGTVDVEGDWSNSAFFLGANALGSNVTVTGLLPDSPQGDRTAAHLIPQLEICRTISAADIPDLVPILAVVAGAKQGAVFTNVQRLRLKESDRVESVASLIRALGGRAEIGEDTLTIFGTGYRGGLVDAQNDHRIAMAAAVAATISAGPVTILGAECVRKSYPRFFEEYCRLGGSYEQYLR